MDLAAMDLKDYCALNRPRFYIDPKEDAGWMFGNQKVQQDLLNRMRSDLDVRGVPKCAVLGRFGVGKTHTLNHIGWLVEQNPNEFPVRPFYMTLVWDEGNKDLNSWRGIHVRMLDALGEHFLREIVREYDVHNRAGDKDLAEAIRQAFRFGDENLRQSLSVILAEYFKRDMRNTSPAWQWLRAERTARLDQLGVPKLIENAGDMVDVVLNLACLWRSATGQGLLFLIDEAQYMSEIKRAESEVHRALRILADQDNRDLGFVFAIHGSGMNAIPSILRQPDDILSRMGVTSSNVTEAFIDLQLVIQTQAELRAFMESVLDHLVDPSASADIIETYALADIGPCRLPFTKGALDRLAQVLFAEETKRNPRQIIDMMARSASAAYRRRKDSEYAVVDQALVEDIAGGL